MEYDYIEAKDQLNKLIANRKSFVITGLAGILIDATSLVEREVERQGMSCRVYTRNRAYAAGAMAWSGAGLLSLAAIAAHNIATMNPDYEIGRSIVDNKLHVDYKK